MNVERDKFLTEQLGECWHEWEVKTYELEIEGTTGIFYKYKCSCGGAGRIIKPNDKPLCGRKNKSYSTWESFGKLLEFAQGQKWAGEFIFNYFGDSWKSGLTASQFIYHQINPDRFANSLYEYLKETNNGL